MKNIQLFESDDLKIINNTEIERVQLYFSSIPTEEIRNDLKKHGWHWSPYNKAWQRQNTENGLYDATRVQKKWFPEAMSDKMSEKTSQETSRENEKQELLDDEALLETLQEAFDFHPNVKPEQDEEIDYEKLILEAIENYEDSKIVSYIERAEADGINIHISDKIAQWAAVSDDGIIINDVFSRMTKDELYEFFVDNKGLNNAREFYTEQVNESDRPAQDFAYDNLLPWAVKAGYYTAEEAQQEKERFYSLWPTFNISYYVKTNDEFNPETIKTGLTAQEAVKLAYTNPNQYEIGVYLKDHIILGFAEGVGYGCVRSDIEHLNPNNLVIDNILFDQRPSDPAMLQARRELNAALIHYENNRRENNLPEKQHKHEFKITSVFHLDEQKFHSDLTIDERNNPELNKRLKALYNMEDKIVQGNDLYEVPIFRDGYEEKPFVLWGKSIEDVKTQAQYFLNKIKNMNVSMGENIRVFTVEEVGKKYDELLAAVYQVKTDIIEERQNSKNNNVISKKFNPEYFLADLTVDERNKPELKTRMNAVMNMEDKLAHGNDLYEVPFFRDGFEDEPLYVWGKSVSD